ncbi:MAG: hypothetical protein RDV48_20360 [Candidatus Eremiobacteraeota bacterium]|nr:hypothetical protein [Candidatus Eremiobacteraeota bacterium]
MRKRFSLFLILFFAAFLTCRVYSETFENRPGGMSVEYSITGLSLSAPQDREIPDREGSGNVYIRDYEIKYKTKGERVTFSGRVSDANASSELAEYLEVYLACINKDSPWGPTSDLPGLEQKGLAKSYFIAAPSQAGSFSLALDVPSGYKVCFMLYLFRSPNDYDTTNYQKSLYDLTPLSDHRSSYGYDVLAIYGISTDAPEWTTVVEPPVPAATAPFPMTAHPPYTRPPPDDSGTAGGFALTVALVAATLAIIAAAVKSGKKAKPGDVLRYILKLSTQKIDFSAGHPAPFDASAWKVAAGSTAPLPAPGAAITITLPAGCKGIQVTPLTGTGTIQCFVSMVGAFTDPVTLTIEAREGASTAKAEIEVLPPVLEIAAMFEPEQMPSRQIDAVMINKNEFIANGEDKARAILYVRVRGDARPPREQVIKEAEFVDISLDGRGIGPHLLEATTSIGFIRYLVEEDADDKAFNADRKNKGCRRVSIRAREPMLYTEVNAGHILNIHALARVRPAEGEGGQGRLVVCNNIEVHPLFHYLKLWIYPGRRPGTSEASAFVALSSSMRQALRGVHVRLRVESQGSGQLAREGPEEYLTDERGLTQVWTLRYSGMNWQNVNDARFRVICGISRPLSADRYNSEASVSEALDLTIDVGANARALVADIYDRRAQINLDNPAFEGMVPLLPPMLRGPFVNIVHSFNNSLFNDYICSDYATRLRNFMATRRFGPDTAGGAGWRQLDVDACFSMNGIEFQEYSVIFLIIMTHHFTGLYLSGTSATGEPRFIDPWWSQHWSSPAYRNIDGLDTMASEVAYVSVVHVSLALLTNAVYAVALAKGWMTAMDCLRWITLLGANANAIGETTAASLLIGVYREARVLNDAGDYDRHHIHWSGEGVRYLVENNTAVPTVGNPVAW